MGRANRPELGDRDLLLGEDLEEERLELGVGAVDLVEQEHGRDGALERLEQGAGNEELPVEERGGGRGEPLGRAGAAGRRRGLPEELGREHLLGVVPLVERLRLVEPLVALETDARPSRGSRRARGRGPSCPRPRAPRAGAGGPARARARPRAPSADLRCRCGTAHAPGRSPRRTPWRGRAGRQSRGARATAPSPSYLCQVAGAGRGKVRPATPRLVG